VGLDGIWKMVENVPPYFFGGKWSLRDI